GILTLFVAIPLINQPLILVGGTLVFTATALLLKQLYALRASQTERSVNQDDGSHRGRKFYIVGLSYFLLGIFIGTGLWLGWNGWLKAKAPIEVHIHANNWGFLSLVFAGLLVDMYPTWAKRSLA